MASEETVVISRAEYERLRSLESTVSVLQHQLAELQRLIFGAKSERFIPSAEHVWLMQGVSLNMPRRMTRKGRRKHY